MHLLVENTTAIHHDVQLKFVEIANMLLRDNTIAHRDFRIESIWTKS